MPGKVDWMARALPLEGEKAGEPRAIDLARTDVVTCALQDSVASVRDRVTASPYGFAFVLGPDGVLLGRLRKAALKNNPDANAEDVMEPGPSTTRPDIHPNKLLTKLQDAELTTAVLSDPEGRLLGIVRRQDLETRAS
jgi:CBS-domain-containing membrane protein